MNLSKKKIIVGLVAVFAFNIFCIFLLRGAWLNAFEFFPGKWPVPLMVDRLSRAILALVAGFMFLLGAFCVKRSGEAKILTALVALLILQSALVILGLKLINIEMSYLVKSLR